MPGMKYEPRCVKKTIALTSTEARAIAWYAKSRGLRGLAPLRLHSAQTIVAFYEDRGRK